ncbi:MAG TPA: putative metalloprotease CJM1_0395 family protein, partial [Aliarcobacter sp.]|nr:putative metalloprotease CJM1_0395 family protein [Aliarcobacter sp.]
MEISNNNLYSLNIDYFSKAKAQKETKSNEQKVEPDTNAVEKNESSTKSKYEENQEKKENPTKLTSDEEAEVFKLKAIDSKIKAHEMAHKSGPASSGGATYSYTKGPDGLMYATAGEVPVEIKTGDTPQETISNMHDVIATALAPSDPSPQDLSIASKARVIMMKAQQEFTKE